MILDKSGSMNSVRDATISGLNEQLDSIKQASEDFDNQEQIVCFVTFNSDVDTEQVWNEKIEDVDNFTRESYVPCSLTSLHDAIGMGINKLRNEIQDELSNRQANVVVTIFTDGQENTSKEFSGSDVRDLVNEVQDSGQWTVAFVGCGGEEVFNVAQSLGVSRGNTMSYSSGEAGTSEAFTTMSHARYSRSMMYSSSLDEGVKDMTEVNDHGFFDNIDLDDDE